MAKYYIDTCIWRDYFENRSDRFRPLGEWAHGFLNKALKNKDIIITSKMVRLELLDYFKEVDVERIFESYEKLIVDIEIDKGIMSVAKEFRRSLSHGDAIHAAIAKKHCAVFITRDKHFDNVPIDVKRPEDLL